MNITSNGMQVQSNIKTAAIKQFLYTLLKPTSLLPANCQDVAKFYDNFVLYTLLIRNYAKVLSGIYGVFSQPVNSIINKNKLKKEPSILKKKNRAKRKI